MRLRLLALSLLLVAGVTGAKDWKEIRVGIDPTYEPFTYKTPDGKPTGFDVDIAQALCDQLKAKCTFVEQDWKGIIPALNARKFDTIISSMSITEERKKEVAFSDKYYNTPSRVIAKTDGKTMWKDSDYKGKKIGVLKASTQENYALKYLKPKGAEIIAYDQTTQHYLDMVSGRLDGAVADIVEAKGGLLSKPEGKAFGSVSGDLIDKEIFGVGVGVAMRKADKDLQAKINEAIKAIRANGVYKTVNDKYFDFDAYGK